MIFASLVTLHNSNIQIIHCSNIPIDLQNCIASLLCHRKTFIHLFSLLAVVELPGAVRAESHLDQRVLLHPGLHVTEVNFPRPKQEILHLSSDYICIVKNMVPRLRDSTSGEFVKPRTQLFVHPCTVHLRYYDAGRLA